MKSTDFLERLIEAFGEVPNAKAVIIHPADYTTIVRDGCFMALHPETIMLLACGLKVIVSDTLVDEYEFLLTSGRFTFQDREVY
jgi:hypothetical protein